MNTLRHRRVAGFSLIELLVATVVLAVGLLGVAALQSVALKSSRTALHRSYATFYAYDIIDAMRVNRPAAVEALAYNINLGADANPGTIAGNDLDNWKTALARDLPEGDGAVQVSNPSRVLIRIQWREGVEADQVLEFRTETSL